MAFRDGIVVGRVRAAVRLGDAEVGGQRGGGLGLHRRTPVGMEGEPAGGHLMLGQTTELAASFARSTIPGEDAIERAARTRACPLVEQSRSGFGRRQIGEPRLARRVEDCGAVHLAQRPRGFWLRPGRAGRCRSAER